MEHSSWCADLEDERSALWRRACSPLADSLPGWPTREVHSRCDSPRRGQPKWHGSSIASWCSPACRSVHPRLGVTRWFRLRPSGFADLGQCRPTRSLNSPKFTICVFGAHADPSEGTSGPLAAPNLRTTTALPSASAATLESGDASALIRPTTAVTRKPTQALHAGQLCVCVCRSQEQVGPAAIPGLMGSRGGGGGRVLLA